MMNLEGNAVMNADLPLIARDETNFVARVEQMRCGS